MSLLVEKGDSVDREARLCDDRLSRKVFCRDCVGQQRGCDGKM